MSFKNSFSGVWSEVKRGGRFSKKILSDLDGTDVLQQQLLVGAVTGYALGRLLVYHIIGIMLGHIIGAERL